VRKIGHHGAVPTEPDPTRPPCAEVLVVGDANPDLVLSGDVIPRFGQAEQLLDDASLVIGGSAAITAHGLARLGRSVALIAAVGDDVLGQGLTDLLDEAGVATDRLVVRRGLASGLTVVLNRGADRAMLTSIGAIDSLTAAEVLEAATALRRGGLRHVHVASYYLQPRLARELVELLRALRDLGLTTSLDTNDDPSGRWDGVDALLPHLDLLLPNRAEVVALGRDTDPRRAAQALAARGPTTVVKDGERGAFAVVPDGSVTEAAAAAVTPVDTTGAGDTFDAAFLAGWWDGLGLEASLRRAVVAGRLSVASTGGTAGQPTSDQITGALAGVPAPSGGHP
jgi:sugar/nucleoside kinase (ribokinase family)